MRTTCTGTSRRESGWGGYLAAEAKYETNRRRLQRLDAAYDQLSNIARRRGELTTASRDESDRRSGSPVAGSVRRAIGAISVPGVEREITASLGVAGLLEHAGNAAGLLHEVDKAQYAAKAAGRNRTVVAGSTPPASAAAETVQEACASGDGPVSRRAPVD